MRGAFREKNPARAPVVGRTQTSNLVRRRESECFPIWRKVDLIGSVSMENGAAGDTRKPARSVHAE